jgi:hypothetical protein
LLATPTPRNLNLGGDRFAIQQGARALGLALSTEGRRTVRLFSIAAIAALLWTASLQTSALPADDLFQQAVNYVFTGSLDPQNGPEILDRKSCVVVVPEPRFNRPVKYYLKRFKMDGSRIIKKYAGTQVLYELEVEGDDTIVEYLKPDKIAVDYGFKSAHISLPGNIDQTERALHLIFADFCKMEKPKSPF